MDYCGIDLAGVSSYVYVTDDRGKKLTAGEVATDKAAFERRLKRFVSGGLSIAIEAGNQTAWVYEALVEMGATVTVVNPTKVKLIAESRRKATSFQKSGRWCRAIWLTTASRVSPSCL